MPKSSFSRHQCVQAQQLSIAAPEVAFWCKMDRLFQAAFLLSARVAFCAFQALGVDKKVRDVHTLLLA